MKISRFFQEEAFTVGETYELSSINHRHIVQVLRSNTDDKLIVFNGHDGEYIAKLEILSKRKSQIFIQSFEAISRESPLKVTLALAMIKPDKMDFALQKAVELGVNAFQPLYTKRSVIKIKENRLAKKMLHWHGVIIAACEQSGRTAIPIINKPTTIENFLETPSSNLRLTLLPGDYPKLASLKDLDSSKQEVSILVGPEGGFTDEEERLMLKAELTPVSFGSRILRAETAAIAALTACQQRWGDL